MKILIYGSGKSGTTALTYAIKNAFQPEDYSIVFEPTNLNRVETLAPNIIVKSLQVQQWKKEIKNFDYFHKKIIILRHPFDLIVSHILYSPYNGYGFSNDNNTNAYINLLKRKVAEPDRISFQEIINMHQEITKSNALDAIKNNYQSILEIVKQHNLNFYKLRYEDFVDGKLSELNSYLGIEVKNQVTVDSSFKRVTRSKKHSDWKNWFLDNDAETIADTFRDFLNMFQYDYKLDDTERNIAPETSSLYVANVINEYRKIYNLPAYNDDKIKIGEEGNYIDQAVHFLRIENLENMQKAILQAFQINPNLQATYSTLEKLKEKRLGNKNNKVNNNTWKLKITDIDNSVLQEKIIKLCLDSPKENNFFADKHDSVVIKGWVLPKEEDISIKICAKTIKSEKETGLSIKRPDVVERVLKQEPLDSPFLYCGFNLEIDLSERIDIFICINGINYHCKTIECAPPLASTISDAQRAWHNFIHNKIGDIWIKDAKALQSLDPDSIDNYIYQQPQIIIKNIDQAIQYNKFNDDERNFLKSFFSQINSSDFCAELVESALKNGFCSITNPFGEGQSICNQSFHLLPGLTALRFVTPNGETFFILQMVTSADAIYFPTKDLLFVNRPILLGLIPKFLVTLSHKFTSVLSYVIKSSENKFAGIVCSYGRPAHFYYDNCYGLYSLSKRNLISGIPAIYLYQGADYFSVKKLFNATCDEYIKEKNFFVDKLQDENKFYIHIGSDGLNDHNKIAQEEISKMIVAKATELVDSETSNEIKIAKECYPLLWFGVTVQKRSWLEQIEGGAKIITELAKIYPKIGVVFDGWTSPLHPVQIDINESAKDQEVANKIIELLPQQVKTFSVVGATTIRKLAFANIIDVFIANNGTGSIHVDRFAKKPGVSHISNPLRNVSATQIHYYNREVPSDQVIDIPDPDNPRVDYCSYSIDPNVILNMVKEILNENT